MKEKVIILPKHIFNGENCQNQWSIIKIEDATHTFESWEKMKVTI